MSRWTVILKWKKFQVSMIPPHDAHRMYIDGGDTGDLQTALDVEAHFTVP